MKVETRVYVIRERYRLRLLTLRKLVTDMDAILEFMNTLTFKLNDVVTDFDSEIEARHLLKSYGTQLQELREEYDQYVI